MKLISAILLTTLVGLLYSCSVKPEKDTDMKYSSAITFLYYEDFSYGVEFFEQILQLNLVMDQGFARVYQVNEKAYLGMVQKKDEEEVSGNTLFSLTTSNVKSEYSRVKVLEVYELSEIKHFESIPLKSFFFDDKEGHKFEIQQFLKADDVEKF